MLYADDVYGAPAMLYLLQYLPPDSAATANGSDFLAAFQQWVAEADSFTTTLPVAGGAIYLPRGAWRVTADGPLPKPLSLAGGKAERSGDAWSLKTTASGWRILNAPGPLHWEKLAK